MKRAQITLFIIIGIVILLVIALGVFALKYIVLEKPPEESIIEQTADEVEPVRTFVKDCVEVTSESVFNEIGAHGGYYDPLQAGILAVPTRPTQGNGFEAFDGLTVPYWYYLSSADTCTNCLFASARPPLNGDMARSISSQAARAIEDNLDLCLRDFSPLQNRFTIVETGAPQVSVHILDDRALLDISYPLVVTTGADSVVRMNNFSTVVDVPIGKAYKYAQSISEAARDIPFFEGLTLEAIVLANAYDPSKIPPPYGSTEMTYSPGPFWVLQSVRQSVAQSVSDMVPLVQVLGTRDMIVPQGSELEMNQYANYYLATQVEPIDASVTFTTLPSWTPYVRVSPGGQVISPDSDKTFLPIIPPIKRNEFQYDVSYPVLVELRVAKRSGEDYLFQFGQEVNMRNNEGLQGGIETEEESTNLCDPITANGQQVTITVTDDVSTAVEASITVNCAGTVCELGAAPGGVLETRLPYCIGGSIRASKDGYGDASVQISPDASLYELEVPQLQTVRVQPQLQFIERMASGWSLGQTRYDATDQQIVVLFVPVLDAARAQAFVYPNELDTVQLAIGEYEVTAIALTELQEPKILKGKQVCGSVLGVNVGCETIPDQTIGGPIVDETTGETIDVESTFYIGGMRRDAETSTTFVTAGMLEDGVITVPLAVVNLNDMVSIDDLDALEKIEEYGATLTLE